MAAAAHAIAALEQQIVELRESVALLRQGLVWFGNQVTSSISQRRLMPDPSETKKLFSEATAAEEEAEVEKVVQRGSGRSAVLNCRYRLTVHLHGNAVEDGWPDPTRARRDVARFPGVRARR